MEGGIQEKSTHVGRKNVIIMVKEIKPNLHTLISDHSIIILLLASWNTKFALK